MNISQYISSGILEEYALGILTEKEMDSVRMMAKQYPEIAAALAANEEALRWFAVKHSFKPSDEVKQNTWRLIENIEAEKQFAIDTTPIINQYSDYRNWMKVVKPLLPGNMGEDVFTRVIRDDGKVTQTLIKTKVHYPDEVHEDVYESFIVLEGECECYIGNNVVRLGPGGYINIPLHEHHDVKVLSSYVVAIQQRIAV